MCGLRELRKGRELLVVETRKIGFDESSSVTSNWSHDFYQSFMAGSFFSAYSELSTQPTQPGLCKDPET
jgi:hypothetical protein